MYVYDRVVFCLTPGERGKTEEKCNSFLKFMEMTGHLKVCCIARNSIPDTSGAGETLWKEKNLSPGLLAINEGFEKRP